MRTIKFVGADGSKNVAYVPTSNREVRRASLAMGYDVWLTKWGGEIDVKLPDGNLVPTKARNLSAFSLKGWIEFIAKHYPYQQNTKGLIYSEYVKLIQKSTL